MLLAVLCALAVPGQARAEVPAENQALLILRILAFDRTAGGRAGDAIRIAIVYRSGQSESEAAHQRLSKALAVAGARSTVHGLPVRIVPVPYSASAATEIAKARVAALYVAPGLEDAVPALSRIAKDNRALSFTGTESYVQRGISVGLVVRGAKAGIRIDLKSAKAEGADLDSGLLSIAEVSR